MINQFRVGIVGTGYAARKRAEALRDESRATLVAIAGQTPSRTTALAQAFIAEPLEDWQRLAARSDLDLIFICTINQDHGPVVEAALQAGKHVVVEYPLSLDYAQAQSLVELAEVKGLMLHVEHIERLGGMHQALLAQLDHIGQPHWVRYATIAPKAPAPRRWSFHHQQLGFPLMAALSRIHRLTHAFGPVTAVSCQAKFWPAPEDPSYFVRCLCHAQLEFESGVFGQVTYAKGEGLWQAERLMEVTGDHGALRFEQEKGCLIGPNGTQEIAVGGRRGLFAKDTAMVLDHLQLQKSLYVSVAESLYSLEVADAARRAAESGQTIQLPSSKSVQSVSE